jgi:serine/threonine protein kinase/formylglycine-generating enzyme required for sulfatase activity
MQQKDFFERYEIDIKSGRLGGGAFGTVYKAYDHLRDQWKAIKIAEVKIIDGKEFSLISEFEASQAIPLHKNVAHYESVYQFHMPNGLFDYAVMQYYPEGNLKQLLNHKKLQLEEKFSLVNSLLQGITFLHKNGIIHRDIKPSNILISIDTRSQYVPKIADFGLSKHMGDADYSNITNSFGGGTLDYSSPEQLYGHPLRPNSDLWSFGVIVYEIFTNKKPFDSDEVTGSPEAKRRIIYQNIVNSKIPADINLVPNPYDDIVRLCLISDPSKRVKKGDDLIDFLKNPTPIFIAEQLIEDEETLIIPNFRTDNDNFDPIAFFKNKANELLGKESLKPILTTEEKILLSAEEASSNKEADDKIADEKAAAALLDIQVQKEKEEQEAKESKRIADELEANRVAEEARIKKEADDKIAAEKAAAALLVIQAKKEKDALEAKEAKRIADELEAKRVAEEARIKKEADDKIAAEQEAAALLAIQVQKEKDALEAQEAKRLADEAEAKRVAEEARIKKEADNKLAAEKEAAALLAIQAQKEKAALEAQEAKRVADEAEAKRVAEEARIKKEADDKIAAEKEAAALLAMQVQKQKEAQNAKEARKIANEAETNKIAQEARRKKEAEEKKRRLILWWNHNGKYVISAIAIMIISILVYYTISTSKADEDNLDYNVVDESGYQYLMVGTEKIVGIFDSIVVNNDKVLGYKLDSLFRYNAQEKTFIFESLKASEILSENETINNQKAEVAYEKIKKAPKEKVNISMLESFLNTFPGSKYEMEIKLMIKKMLLELEQSSSENSLYEQILSTPTVTLIDVYLKKFPKGKHIKEISELLGNIKLKEENQMWDAVIANPTIAGLDAYLIKYPQGKYVTLANKQKQAIIDQKQKELDQKKEDAERTKIDNPVTEIKPENTNTTISEPIAEAPSKKEALPAAIVDIENDFVKIPSGQHTLGCLDKEKGCDPKIGIKNITLSSFMMSKYEVTQEKYSAIMGDNPSYYNDKKRNPVENVTFQDVQAFITKLNNIPGNPYKYRLPTEAEWEYAALGGTNQLYAGSDDASSVAIVEKTGSSLVGKKKSNKWGLYDMSGNVAEWCQDDYGDFNGGKTSPKFKVVKGGSYLESENMAKVKKRNKAEANRPFTFIGFRLVRDLK